jgi:hypothetical protein
MLQDRFVEVDQEAAWQSVSRRLRLQLRLEEGR